MSRAQIQGFLLVPSLSAHITNSFSIFRQICVSSLCTCQVVSRVVDTIQKYVEHVQSEDQPCYYLHNTLTGSIVLESVLAHNVCNDYYIMINV
jgi:hypothetical protein